MEKPTDQDSGASVRPVRVRVDWDACERDYRTGNFTLRELGEKHGCTHAAVKKQADKHGWTQDLSDAIRQATNARLTAELVTTAVDDGFRAVTDTVQIAAHVNAQVILGHRNRLRDITQVRDILLSQIMQAAADMPDLSEVIEMVRKPDDNGIDRANDALRKAMARPALVDDLKKLAEIDERVRKGEREAFNIGTGDSVEKPAKRITLDFVDVVPK